MISRLCLYPRLPWSSFHQASTVFVLKPQSTCYFDHLIPFKVFIMGSFFSDCEGLSIYGGNFNEIGGDLTINNNYSQYDREMPSMPSGMPISLNMIQAENIQLSFQAIEKIELDFRLLKARHSALHKIPLLFPSKPHFHNRWELAVLLVHTYQRMMPTSNIWISIYIGVKSNGCCLWFPRPNRW